MADIGVTMNARRQLAVGAADGEFVDKVGVAMNARSLSHAPVAGFDLDRVVEVFQREGEGVEEAVVALDDPFADRVMRQMAIVADGDMAMAALLPGVEVVLHDMTIRAAVRIVAEVAPAFAVAEGKGADPAQEA